MQVLASEKMESGIKYAYIRIVKACHQTASLYTAVAIGNSNIKYIVSCKIIINQFYERCRIQCKL